MVAVVAAAVAVDTVAVDTPVDLAGTVERTARAWMEPSWTAASIHSDTAAQRVGSHRRSGRSC
jgi:hypothetical protein